MTTVLFYILGFIMLTATLLCITRRNPVHAVIYLVAGFFALALMFYLLGAPLAAAWQIIVYAGAIMVLFLFIIMMLGLAPQETPEGPGWRRWGPLVLLSASLMVCTVLLIMQDPAAGKEIGDFYLAPQAVGESLFGRYVLAVEMVSFQLLFATIGAYLLGRPLSKGEGQ
ncbi:MAG: NADH-quinone oxidoreductase subunit J [Deltaproteobacteria bacterium]|jgi:NADH-quinone oxidoreductase subunit J|nr:NADH-quinone oxidoreductase subunit J [Deltaproteobacteria bacterium]